MVLRATNQCVDVLAVGSGSLRTTAQYADILVNKDGNLRVTNQYVEILTEAISPPFVTNDLVVTATVTAIKIINVYVNNSLGFDFDGFSGQRISAITTLDVDTDSSYFWFPNEREVVNTDLDFSIGLEIEGWKTATTNLVLTQTVAVQQPYYINASNRIYFTVSSRNTNFPVAVVTTLDLEATTGRAYFSSVLQSFVLTADAERLTLATSTLVFTQSILVGKTRGIPVQEIDFNITLDTETTYHKTVVQDLSIGQAITYYLDDPCYQHLYHPFLGVTELSILDDLPLTEPLQQEESGNGITLRYPSVGEVVTEVVLRGPELDNQDALAFNRINQETRGGELIIYADPIWPKINTLTLNFFGLLKTEVDDVIDFINDYLGQEISLTDWEGRVWYGVISSGENSAIQNYEHNWSFSFTFVGELVDYYPEANHVDMVNSASTLVDYVRTLTETIDFEITTSVIGIYNPIATTTLTLTNTAVGELIDV
jgi:hypothetical protein